MEIYEDGIQIGTLQVKEDGLYAVFEAKTEPSEQIRRVYLAYPGGARYLGLPDQNGYFRTNIPRKQLPSDYCAVATTAPKGQWLPWRGMVDGVLIESAWIGNQMLAMPLNEAMKFPAWEMEITETNDKQMALLPLSADGEPLPREREAERNETVYYDDFAGGDAADLPADECVGGTGWQADCADI